MLSTYRERRGEEGFTLIELLVVIIIIGILAAIAIPTFLGQRERARRSAVQSDLRNLAVAQETYFTDNGSYSTTLGALEYTPSDDVVATVESADSSQFCMKAIHNAGLPDSDGGAWYYDSDDDTQLTNATEGTCADD